jgi:hypothetical protein
MRFDTVPDFDHSELCRIILGLIQLNGLATFRRFDHGHDRDEKLSKILSQPLFCLKFTDSCNTHVTIRFLFKKNYALFFAMPHQQYDNDFGNLARYPDSIWLI